MPLPHAIKTTAARARRKVMVWLRPNLPAWARRHKLAELMLLFHSIRLVLQAGWLAWSGRPLLALGNGIAAAMLSYLAYQLRSRRS